MTSRVSYLYFHFVMVLLFLNVLLGYYDGILLLEFQDSYEDVDTGRTNPIDLRVFLLLY